MPSATKKIALSELGPDFAALALDSAALTPLNGASSITASKLKTSSLYTDFLLMTVSFQQTW
jgi:hypothetical protein